VVFWNLFIQEALAKELSKAKIPFKQQEKLNIYYDNEILKKYFMADFVCYDKIIEEIKATHFLTEKMNQQVINYLKSTNFEVRLLLNFGEKSLKWKRLLIRYLNNSLIEKVINLRNQI
jgi:GxxExxY protein